MAKIRRISDRDQITLKPKRTADGALAPKDCAALDKLVQRQTKAGAFSDYPNPTAARKHLHRPRA